MVFLYNKNDWTIYKMKTLFHISKNNDKINIEFNKVDRFFGSIIKSEKKDFCYYISNENYVLKYLDNVIYLNAELLSAILDKYDLEISLYKDKNKLNKFSIQFCYHFSLLFSNKEDLVINNIDNNFVLDHVNIAMLSINNQELIKVLNKIRYLDV